MTDSDGIKAQISLKSRQKTNILKKKSAIHSSKTHCAIGTIPLASIAHLNGSLNPFEREKKEQGHQKSIESRSKESEER